MTRLPVIVSFGGISPAGRSSFHYAYQRLVYDALPRQKQLATLQNLAVLTSQLNWDGQQWFDNNNEQVALEQFLQSQEAALLDGTLIRKLENNLFDPQQLVMHSPAALTPAEGDTHLFTIPKRKLPNRLPDNWQIVADEGRNCKVQVTGDLDIMIRDTFSSPVNTAGQLPSGFQPDMLYAARSHPRALQMTIYGASDALYAMGIDWEQIRQRVPADQISVYAGSAMSQLDYNGYGGLLQARLLGRKITSKQLPLGFGDMPADFINAYMVGNIGNAGTNLGACASFLYNLRQAVNDIQTGKARVVLLGSVEAPITPEIIEAFANMNALADDDSLLKLDAALGRTTPDHRRACRPFGNNVGFTLSESAQFFVLMDDELALEMGANIHGAINDVFVNADGFKKSIAGPGVGNYLTVARAVAATRAVLGDEALRERSFVQAHGTGTPQNRVTESEIFSEIATQLGISNWPVTAMKSYLGHSIACAAGDQLAMTLGVWKHGIIPGILTTDQLADDVSSAGLDILLQHKQIDPEQMDAAIINSKGFGGNNATASVLAPHITHQMLEKRHGKARISQWQQANAAVAASASKYQQQSSHQHITPIYNYDHDVRNGSDLTFTDQDVTLRGYSAVSLKPPNPYKDMC